MMDKAVMQSKKRLRLTEQLEAFLLACIINMNILRFAFSIYDTSILLYGIYALYILFGIFNHGQRCNIKFSLLNIGIILLLLIAILTSFLIGDGAINSAIKLVLSVIIAGTAFAMSFEQIVQTIKFIIWFNLIYCVVILINPENALAYMNSGGDGTNYLTMTLTIGLLAAMSLAYVINLIFTKINLIKIVVALSVCLVSFMAMLKFAARGPILLSILAVIIIYVLLAVNNKRKFLLTTAVVVVIALIALQIFFSFADPYLIKRMMSLFENIADEERIVVWTKYLDVIMSKKLFIFGGGTNSAIKLIEYYPHNIYLQLLGEFGLLGAFVAIMFTVKIAGSILRCNKMLKSRKVPLIKKSVFYLILGAFLYYFLTFMKSFTLYDACPLFVFCTLLFRVEIILNNYMAKSRESYQYARYEGRRVYAGG